MSHKNLYLRIIGFLIKKGSRVKAEKIVNDSFFTVSKRTGLSFSKISSLLSEKLGSFVEVKKVRIRRGSHTVPFSVSSKRRAYLIVKWLMQAVFEDKRKIPLSQKLSFEIEQTVSRSPSKSVKLKNLNLSQSLSNRSNVHFRW
jgi:ribosomal protein S7